MKISVSEFIHQLLTDAGCKGVVNWGDSITAQCCFHWNKKNFKTFRVSTVETVNKKTGLLGYYFHCFSCGEGGTVVSLIAYLLSCSRKKALKIFEKRTNVSAITIDTLLRDLKQFKRDDVTEFPEMVMPPMDDNQKPMLAYLKRRYRMAHRFWDTNYLIDKYELYYCSYGRMAGRIIMPIKDLTENIICYNDRTILDSEERKSLHIKGWPYGRVLHGLYESIGKKYVILTEGAFDMFAVDCALKGTKHENKFGIVNMMGTAFTDDRMDLLAGNFDRIYLMLDNDRAGRDMTTDIFKQHGNDADIRCCTESYPRDKDPAICTKEEILRAIRRPVRRQGYLEYLTRTYENA